MQLTPPWLLESKADIYVPTRFPLTSDAMTVFLVITFIEMDGKHNDKLVKHKTPETDYDKPRTRKMVWKTLGFSELDGTGQ